MVVGAITTYAIGAIHHTHCEFEPHVISEAKMEGTDMIYFDDFLGDGDVDNKGNKVVYSIQLYVIMFPSDLPEVGVFLQILRFPPPVLKVALNTHDKYISY
jgi:hypothetical protein